MPDPYELDAKLRVATMHEEKGLKKLRGLDIQGAKEELSKAQERYSKLLLMINPDCLIEHCLTRENCKSVGIHKESIDFLIEGVENLHGRPRDGLQTDVNKLLIKYSAKLNPKLYAVKG